MPTYIYKCVRCSRQEEVIHGINDDYSDNCICGGDMRKVFTPAGIQFKGSGFFSTDNRGK